MERMKTLDELEKIKVKFGERVSTDSLTALAFLDVRAKQRKEEKSAARAMEGNLAPVVNA